MSGFPSDQYVKAHDKLVGLLSSGAISQKEVVSAFFDGDSESIQKLQSTWEGAK